jgi:hypothetical protein
MHNQNNSASLKFYHREPRSTIDPYKIQRLSLYTQRKSPNIGVLSYPGLVSLQPNSDGYSLSDATLTAHGSCKGSS